MNTFPCVRGTSKDQRAAPAHVQKFMLVIYWDQTSGSLRKFHPIKGTEASALLTGELLCTTYMFK